MEATKGFDYVIRMAQNAPFEIRALTDSFVKLKAAGVDPMGGSMQGLVDSVAKFGGTSETLHRASIAIQQMAGKGVISMEELRQQLGEAIPNAMQLMARASGVSVGELVKQISKGKVTSQEALTNLFIVMRLENQGAAAEMMKTWTGLTAQIKTQFELLGKQIGDAGFFEEVKKQASTLLEFLKSDAGRQFAAGMGSALTTAVRNVADMVGWLVRMKDVLLTVGAGFAGLVAWSKLSAMVMQSGAMDVVRAERAKWAAIAAEQQKATAAAIGMQVKEKEGQIASNTAIIAMKQRHYATLEAMQARHLAAAAALEARFNSAGQFVDSRRRFASGGPAARQEIQALTDKAAALGMMQRARLSEMNVLDQQNIKLRENATKLAQTSAAAIAAAGHIGILTRMATLWRAALLALGGPIGAVLTALSFAIPMWILWGDKGKEAIEKVQNALASGTAGRGDRVTAEARIEEIGKKIEKTQGLLDYAIASNDNAGAAALRADLFKHEQDLAKWQADLKEIDTQTIKNEMQRGADDFRKAFEERTNNVANAYRKQHAELGVRMADIQKDTSLTAPAREAAMKAIRDEAVALDKAHQKVLSDTALERYRQVKAHHDQLRRDKISITSETWLKSKGALEEAEKKMAELNKIDAAMPKYGTLTLGSGTDGNKAPKADVRNPLAEMIEQAEGNLEAANIRLRELGDGVMSFDAIYQAELAKLRGKGNKLDTVTKTGDVETRTAASEEELRRMARLTTETIVATKNTEILANVARQAASAEEALADAQERLANNGETLNGGYERAIINLNRMRAGIIDTGTAMDDFDRSAARIRGAAIMTDLTNFVSDLSRRNNELEAAAVVNTRERQTAIFEAYRDSIMKRFTVYSASLKREKGDTAETAAEITKMWDLVSKHIQLSGDVMRRQTMTQLERWLEAAQDMTSQIDNMTTNWAGNFIDMIVNATSTGKLAWKDMITSMLQDLLRLTLNKQISSSLATLAGGAGNWLAGLFGGGGGGGGYVFPSGAALATGGVMTGLGPMSLNRYANGGIAKSPQVALFGEGSRPEAYVPLPDGRSIPVTMAGAPPAVTVNVINQSGQQVQATQSGPRFDGKQMILDVVLHAAAQPGNFREGMRGAMR
jgi:tape measure domain-containing protein